MSKDQSTIEIASELSRKAKYHMQQRDYHENLSKGFLRAAEVVVELANGSGVEIPVQERSVVKQAKNESGRKTCGPYKKRAKLIDVNEVAHRKNGMKKQLGKSQVGKIIREWIKEQGGMTREQILNRLIKEYSLPTVNKHKKKITAALSMLVYLKSGGVKVKKSSVSKWEDLYSIK